MGSVDRAKSGTSALHWAFTMRNFRWKLKLRQNLVRTARSQHCVNAGPSESITSLGKKKKEVKHLPIKERGYKPDNKQWRKDECTPEHGLGLSVNVCPLGGEAVEIAELNV
ncbi:uncharacterized [Tachysurus ichikawai]